LDKTTRILIAIRAKIVQVFFSIPDPASGHRSCCLPAFFSTMQGEGRDNETQQFGFSSPKKMQE
jgi:hypothetical protein